MRYTLDTNAVTAVLRPDERTVGRLEAVLADGHEVTLNAISYFEVKRGLTVPRFARRLADFMAFVEGYGVLPLDLSALDQAVTIYQELRASGAPLEDADILIAAIAVSKGAILVTHNVRHLGRVRGLQIEDWEA